MGKLIFVTGGTNSGKSEFARNLALPYDDVAFIETALPKNEITRALIAKNKAESSSDWERYVQYKGIGNLIMEKRHTLCIVDCIYMIIDSFIEEIKIDFDNSDESRIKVLEEKILEQIDGITAAVCACDSVVIVVTNEMGLGMTGSDREFLLRRNLCGRANQILARFADEAYLLVSGFAQKLK